MRVVNGRARFFRPVRRFVIGGLVSLAAWQDPEAVRGQTVAAIKSPPAKPSPPTPNPSPSAYSVATPTLTIRYRTSRNPTTGAVTIVAPGAVLSPSDATINIGWTMPTGVPPADSASVVFGVTYNKLKGNFSIAGPVNRVGKNFVISSDQLRDFGDRLLTEIVTKLPPNYDPTTTVVTLGDPVEVSVTPFTAPDPAALTSAADKARQDQELADQLQQDADVADAAAKVKDEAATKLLADATADKATKDKAIFEAAEAAEDAKRTAKLAKSAKDKAAASKAAADKAAAPGKGDATKASNTFQVVLEQAFGDP